MHGTEPVGSIRVVCIIYGIIHTERAPQDETDLERKRRSDETEKRHHSNLVGDNSRDRSTDCLQIAYYFIPYSRNLQALEDLDRDRS